MKRKFNFPIIAVILALAASNLSCTSTGITINTATPHQVTSQTGENIPKAVAQATNGQAQSPPASTADAGLTPEEAAAEPTAAGTPVPTTSESRPTVLKPCAEEICIEDIPNLLRRPVGGEGRVTVDPSYRFGEFRKNSRYPNSGVEFMNSTGTPVVAAAAGQVLAAGTDSQIAYARNLNEYGNLIILEHAITGIDQPVYTLYGHLSEILIQEGDSVEVGQEIGKVGATGNIRGSVLHFEVRVGENTYSAVRNPELWLATGHDENGQALGALAGRISDSQWKILNIRNIVLERLDSSGQAVVGRTYLRTYGGESLWGRSPWGESFGMGDMVPGTYKISYLLNGYQSRLIEVQAGKITLMEIIQ